MANAIITGASRGIGRAIKNIFELRSIRVYAPSRDEMDLSSHKSIVDYFFSINEDIDILVNNAGVNDLAGIEELTEQNIQEIMQVNLISQLELIKLVTPNMKKNKYGRIVNISSIWSNFSKEKRLIYSVSKAGVNGLTKAVAVELSKFNILTNAVAPGFVNTEMTTRNNTVEQIKNIQDSLPINRLANPEEIAEVVYFLASEKNTFITGQTIFADGGFSCI